MVGPGSGSVRRRPGVVAAEADGDGQVGVDRGERRHRQRVEDAAVGEQSAVEHVRLDHAGDRDRRADRRVDRPALQPHRLARDQVRASPRCRGSAAPRSTTSPRISRTASRILSARSTPADVSDGSSSRSTARWVRDVAHAGVLVELARGLKAADQRAHGRPGDADDLVAAVAQFVDHPDVRVPPGTAAAETERHSHDPLSPRYFVAKTATPSNMIGQTSLRRARHQGSAAIGSVLRRRSRRGRRGRRTTRGSCSPTRPDGRLAFQLAPDHEPPRFPDPRGSQQFHLDVEVDDVDDAESKVLALGATRVTDAIGEDDFRVYRDPAGHPFCLVWVNRRRVSSPPWRRRRPRPGR